MKRIDGVADIVRRYDALLLDLWGVVHNGVAPYPGVIDAMAACRAAGFRILLLSNGPRRVAPAIEGLRKLGVRDDLYDLALTSGELTYQMLADRTDPWFARLGATMCHLGPERDSSVYEGLDLRMAPADRADWILNTGLHDGGDPMSLAPYEPILAAGLARGLPMVCANPDLQVVKGGETLLCAGALAEAYLARGGDVQWIGKPHRRIYEKAQSMLDLAPGRILAVGDSLRTDIAGANHAGIDSCWVLGGIHADDNDPAATATQAGFTPDYVTDRFNW